MSAALPPIDWATDFDHTDPRWSEDPYPIWDDLRGRCPIAHTERFNGVYFPTRHQDIRDIAYDTEHFSSRRVVVRSGSIPNLPAPPITSDPPAHRPARMLLLPAFAPKAIAQLEPRSRDVCRKLVDGFVTKGGCDAAADYAQHIPTQIIAHMMGIPEEDGDQFRRWIHMALVAGIKDPSQAVQGLTEMSVYFKQQIALRREKPGSDLISTLLAAEMEGKPVSEEHVVSTLRLILIAGIDTTWSAIGASLWHLATHPEDRARLVAQPELMPTAVEELLRAYAPVTMARVVAKETELGGCTFKEGQMVLLSFPSANRDPEVFADADKVILDREDNRHVAFGLGMHRCIGSNLARQELQLALEEWLRQIPEFSVAGDVVWSEGTVRGPRKLPVRFG